MKPAPVIGGDIDKASRQLKEGKLTAFPTETVYGIGALAKNNKAVAKIFRAKQRPRNHPLIVHLARAADIGEWAANVPAAAERLIKAFMPGALTLVLPKHPAAPSAVCGGGEYVGLRVPSHSAAAALLKKTGEAIAAPSANRFGRLTATTAEDVAAEFENVDVYILRGRCTGGIESAIVGFYNGAPSLLRPGSIGEKQLSEVMGAKFAPPPQNARAPGMLPRHYAPQTPLVVTAEEKIATLARTYKNPAVLSARKPRNVKSEMWRRAQSSPQQYARNLYKLLHELDKTGADAIIAAAPPRAQEWNAVRDRLMRAAKVI